MSNDEIGGYCYAKMFFESVKKILYLSKNIDYANMTCLRVVLLPIACLLVKGLFLEMF